MESEHQNIATDKNLSDDEVNNPGTVIYDFFNFCKLNRHLKKLKKWRKYVISPTFCKNRSWAVSVLFHRELTVRLLEAAWLLREKEVFAIIIEEGTDNKIAKLFIKTERRKFKQYPCNLKRKEILDPSWVLDHTFKEFSISDYRRILNQWLYDALSPHFLEESLEKIEVVTVYDNLIRLFESTWLIFMREEGKLNNKRL